MSYFQYPDDLSKSEVEFLREQEIYPYDLFNARDYIDKGYSVKDYQLRMSDLGIGFAYNATPCGEAGHTIRTRKGHCIQCKTARIAFMKRSLSSGFVYIAFTTSGNYTKVGFTRNIESRARTLNSDEVGGYSDWKLIYVFFSKDAGKIEEKFHTEYKEFRPIIGSLNYNREIYSFDKLSAKNHLFDVCRRNQYIDIKQVSLPI